MHRIAWTLCAAWLLPGVTAARTWNVPLDAPGVAAGLDSSAVGDTVLVACGTYLENGLSMKSGVTLRGASGAPGCVTVDGQSLGRVFDFAFTAPGTRIEGLTVTGGLAPLAGTPNFGQAGGGVRCDSGSVAFTDCVFRANAGRFGAAFSGRASDPVFTRCDFDSNAASDSAWAVGGAIYSIDSDAVIHDCNFTGNTAFATALPGDGGAVFADFSRIDFQRCTFQGNSSGAGGGAFYSFNRDASTLTDCTFTANGSGGGGAVYVETSNPVLKNCGFFANSAGNGGALFVSQFSGVSFTDCVLDSNSADPFSGGAADIWQSSADFLRCDFTFNSSALRGGAASANVGATPTFTDCLFRGNSAVDGGALRATATAAVTLSACDLVENAATGGGGIYCDGQSNAAVDRSLIVFSTAGAAVACAGTATADLTCSNLFGNAGGDWIGCLAGQDFVAGNLSSDPLFCDLAAGDYSVALPGSPCLPQNNSCAVLIGQEVEGCGCPPSATIFVPADQPTIAAALAVAAVGDTIGVCSGVYPETVDVVSGVHILGVRAEFCRVTPGTSPDAVLIAHQVTDSTFVEGLTLDGQSIVPQAVWVDSATTSLHLRGNRITGGATYGVRNGADSRFLLGGALPWANDLFQNGTGSTVHVRNDNVASDSLDATLNWWGTARYDSILTFVQGPVRTCPITNAQHSDSLCAPLSALGVPQGDAAPEISLAVGPNPSRGASHVFFTLPEAVPVRLTIHDVAGRRVRTLHDGSLQAGTHGVVWSGRDQQGAPSAPGVYFLRLEAGRERHTRKIVLLP